MKKDYSKAILLFAAVMFIAFTFKMGQSFKQGIPINDLENVKETTEKILETDEDGKPLYTELTTYTFRTSYLRSEHFQKHGKDMGFKTATAYENRASEVINSQNALIKEEKDEDDGDYIYYLVDTNEIVFLSKDGFIRTYFNPDDGKAYFDRQ